MSYINGIVRTKVKQLLLKTNNGTGSVSTNDIVDLNTTAIFNNTTVTINSNNIVLNSGNYMIDAGLGVHNAADPISNYLSFNITVDNVEQPTPATSTQDNKVGVDSTICAVSVESGLTKTVRLKITGVTGTCNIEDDYSWVRILQV